MLLVFAVVLGAVIGRGFWSYHVYSTTTNRYADLVAEHNKTERVIQRATALALDLETGVRGWMLTSDPVFLEPYNKAISDLVPTLDELDASMRGNPEGAAAASQLRSQLERWNAECGKPAITPAIFERSQEERRALHRAGKEQMDAVRVTLDRLHTALANARASEGTTLDQYRQEYIGQAAMLTIVVSIVFAIAIIVGIRSVERPLSALAEHATLTAEGRFKPVEVTGVREVHELGKALTLMTSKLALDRTRERGFTELVAALGEGGTVEKIASVALRSLMSATGAEAGALFIARDADGPLKLEASAAFDTTTLPKDGDPLAREVRRSLETMYIVSKGARRTSFHVVRTALADVVPRALLIAPIRSASNVFGVVELAGDIEKPDETELERSLSRVGLAIRNALVVEQLAAVHRTLAETNEELQAQNEELKAQEEELRAQSEELVEKQNELGERNTALDRASRSKSDFLSNMSHELRTPLNAVIGFADALLSGGHGELPPNQRRTVGEIQAAGRQLLALVNDILDLSKIEAGRLELSRSVLDLATPVRDACALLDPLAKRKDITLVCNVPRGTFHCLGDSDRIRQVIVNLLSNAVKFTNDGGRVTLTVARSGGSIRVDVSDTGAGIPEKDHARLFQPFTQAGGSRADGTGLGLSICKRLVEAMGGTISFSSTIGKGSTFTFTLPASEAPIETKSLEPMRTAGRSMILIVEDNDVDARVAGTILSRAGFAVAAVPSAEQALDRLERETPDVLIVDLGLPKMSGFALIQRVRAHGPRVPILVLTARDLSPDERNELGRSVDLVAQKGVMTDAGFIDSVKSLLTKPKTAPPPTTNRTLLVIDDNDVNRRVMRAMLEPEGFVIVEKEDAISGIEFARETPPAAVLMDIRMPDMDGIEATKRLRADERTKHIPIIAVSAQAMVGDRERALSAGCIAYVTKPVARRELLDTVNEAIGQATT